jgi:sterol desaturase/sphingolipid hydroxylase (fatty acid hydroxylase superfamily)
MLALVSYGVMHVVGTALSVWLFLNWPWSGLQLHALPLGIDFSVTFVVLEGLRWFVHWLFHRVPLLWSFHAVHHADTEVDISTSFRHHPGEPLISALPVLCVMVLLGASTESLVLYRALDLTWTVWAHTNVSLPARLERALQWVVVTPDFHRAHHFAEQRFTDSHYGSISPWFDYFFKTYTPITSERQASAPLGLDTVTPGEQTVWGMLLSPLHRRRLRGKRQTPKTFERPVDADNSSTPV